MNEQALERAGQKTPAVITTPAEYREALATWAANYNVLTPFTNISGIAASFGLIATVVKLNPDKAAGEVYDGLPFLKANEVAPAKVGLRKLAECGGISTSTNRTDPRTIQHYWEFKAVASYRGLDGSVITREATFEWDLRDGSDRLKGWTANQISEGRKNGLRNCEARAINAAIRECGCGIRQKYTRDELSKPFLVVRVAFQPDLADPDIKRMVTQQALTGASTLYPSTAGHRIDAPVEDDEPRHVGSGSTTSDSAPATEASKPEVDPNRPPTPDAVRIVSAEPKEFIYQNGTRKGTKGLKFVIVDSKGVEYSTFSETHYKDAVRFKAANEWVEIATESNGQYTNIIEITKAGSQPALPNLDNL